MSRTLFGVLSVGIVLSVLSSPVWAEEKGAQPVSPAVVLGFRTGEHPGFDRVVFDAPRGMTYKIRREGAWVTVDFSAPARVAFKTVKLSRAKGFSITRGGAGEEPLAIRFAVHPSAKIKDFFSGTSIVIDVSGQLSEVPSAPPVEKKTDEKTAEVVKETADVLLKETASPREEDKPSAIPPSEEKGKDAAPVAPVPEAAPVVKVQESFPAASPLLTGASWPPPIQNPLDPKALAFFDEVLKEQPPRPVAVFDPQMAIGAAIFVRAGYVTILFDRKLTGNALAASLPPRVKLEPFDLSRNSGFRFRVPDHIGVRATRKGAIWEIYLIRAGGDASLSTDFVAQPDFALGSRLVLPTASPPEPVLYTDPVVKDELLILPFRETGAFTVKRRLSDFQVVPSAQGLVVKPWHERITARIIPDGVELSAEGGLKMSSVQDRGLAKTGPVKGDLNIKRLFDFDQWRGKKEDSFAQSVHKLWRTILDTPENMRVLARLDLARFYFAHVMGYESIALLDVIAQKVPEITNHPDFLGLRGASRILVGRVQEGLADLSDPTLREQPEIVLWRAVGTALLRDWPAAVDLFRPSIALLSVYPEPLHSRFWVLAIEAAAAAGKDKEMISWLAQFEVEGVADSSKEAVSYLRGVMHSKGGRLDQAEKMWKKAAKGRDRLYKIRAELALVDLGVAMRSLTPKQAIEKLEGLRFAWRADDLEFDILKRLGGFYLEDHNFRKGFSTFFQALHLFPTAPQTAQLKADMVKTFQDIFLTDLGKDLTPVEALSLYTDFKTLIPEGPAGNPVRQNLAERLVDVDLLDQAVKLLEDMAKNSSKPEEKARIATRMAGIRLLDHKAQEALTLLDQSQPDVNASPPAVKDEQQLLRARALSEMGKYNEALAVLPANTERSTLLLRADMALRAKVWSDASKAFLELVGPVPQVVQGVAVKWPEEKAAWLVHAAIAMAQMGDVAGLDRLARDYGTVMDGTTKGNLFRVLTRPEDGSQMKDIRAAQSRISESDVFRDILDSYRKGPSK